MSRTLDILSKGRFDFGVAKGGPFALQNKHFLAGPDHSRDMTLEALGLVNRLLYEDHVSFTGEYYQASDVTITPKPTAKADPDLSRDDDARRDPLCRAQRSRRHGRAALSAFARARHHRNLSRGGRAWSRSSSDAGQIFLCRPDARGSLSGSGSVHSPLRPAHRRHFSRAGGRRRTFPSTRR